MSRSSKLPPQGVGSLTATQRAIAPHVQRAVQSPLQAKLSPVQAKESSRPGQGAPLAPHVQAAIAAAQPKMGAPEQGRTGERSLAPHVKSTQPVAVNRSPRGGRSPVDPSGRSVLQPASELRKSSRLESREVVEKISLTSGYALYGAEETSDAGDGSESCEVILTVGRTSYAGSTGKGHGHAEMDALHQIAEALTPAQFQAAGTRTVGRHAKPCCYNCSCALGLLGFGGDEATYKTKKTMGSTEWKPTPTVRAFIEEVIGKQITEWH